VEILLVNTKLKIAVMALALVGTGALVWNFVRTAEPDSGNPVGRIETSAPSSEHPPVLARPASPDGSRESAAVVRQPPASATPANVPVSAEPSIGGHVIDLQGLPVAGVGLRWSRSNADEPAAVISRADGGFELPLAGPRGILVAAGPDFTTLFGAEIHPAGEQKNLLVVVAPRGGIAGLVVDGASHPIQGATVEILCDRQILRGIEVIADQASPVQRRAISGADGRFDLPDAPATASLSVHTSAPGYDGRRQPTPDRAIDDLRIVLARSDRAVLRGEVLDPAGGRVAGVWVGCAGTVVATDPRGSSSSSPARATASRARRTSGRAPRSSSR
jgi:hypothetical protein